MKDDVDAATMERYNLLSRRLYRTLLRSCRQGVEIANRGNTFVTTTTATTNSNENVNDVDKPCYILLQPPMDQRKYGFAKILQARRGRGKGDIDHYNKVLPSHNSSTSIYPKNDAAKKMTKQEVGMAMEVLRFVHVSLGGSAEDDLEDYYLGGCYSTLDNDNANANGNGNGAEEGIMEDESSVSSAGEATAAVAAAGRHAEGHYTQFIDDDDERGEGGGDAIINVSPTKKKKELELELEQDNDQGEELIKVFEQELTKVLEPEDDDDEWDSSDDEDIDNDHDDDDDEDDLEPDESVLVTSADLQNAVRIAFRAPLVSETQSQDDKDTTTTTQPLSTIISRRHGDAINACSQLSEQFNLWGNKSSVAFDAQHGVRVVVTSALMMRPATAAKRYRYSYRVRVENVMDIVDGDDDDVPNSIKPKKEEQTTGDDSGDIQVDDSTVNEVEHRAVQLLGRTWTISERGPWHKTSNSVLQRLLEEGVIENNDTHTKEDGADDEDDELRVVQTVNEPRTGAVGHLPVLGPGEVFEYMSGADIATPSGAMEGCFHLATVDMQKADSAHIGDDVEALHWKSNDERLFEMPVARFGFVADEDLDH